MRRTSIILLTLSLSAALRAETVPVDGYAAVVNDRIITIGDVMNIIQPLEDEAARYVHGRGARTKTARGLHQRSPGAG